ncbi:MAG: glutaminyl-peptide cyclotransferase, partial [Cyclobacteriaceae bacterium]
MRIYFLFLFIVLAACTSKKETIENPEFINYTLQSSFPHDKNAFTQGFVVHNGELYESTGQDNSWIGIIDIKTGIADKKVTLGKEYFGEGITILDNKIYQLTWQNHKGFVYDLKSFEKLREF